MYSKVTYIIFKAFFKFHNGDIVGIIYYQIFITVMYISICTYIYLKVICTYCLHNSNETISASKADHTKFGRVAVGKLSYAVVLVVYWPSTYKLANCFSFERRPTHHRHHTYYVYNKSSFYM